jgi:hypothetical protein
MDLRNNSRGDEAAPAPAPKAPVRSQGRPSVVKQTLMALLIVLTILGIVGLVGKMFSTLTADSAVKGKQYQALFLTNGQVYFGHLAQTDGSYVKLNDIYYLQVQQQVQPKDQNAAQQPQISLAKLGGELHGPEDVMYVSRQQVLFWENLKDDGKVVKAIKDFQASNKK